MYFLKLIPFFCICPLLISSQIDDFNYLGSHFVANYQQDSGLTRAISVGGLNLPRPPSTPSPSPSLPPSPAADNLLSRRHRYGSHDRTVIPFELPDGGYASIEGEGDSLPSIIAVDPNDLQLESHQETPLYHLRQVNRRSRSRSRSSVRADNLLTQEGQGTSYVVLEPINFRPEEVPQAHPLLSQPKHSKNNLIRERHNQPKPHGHYEQQEGYIPINSHRFTTEREYRNVNRPAIPVGKAPDVNIPFILPPTISQRTSSILKTNPNRPIYALVSGTELGEVLDTEFDENRRVYAKPEQKADNLSAGDKTYTQWGWQKQEPRIVYSQPKSDGGSRKSNPKRKRNETFAYDQHSQCCSWSFQNECVRNPSWMLVNCPVSCGVKQCTYSNWHQCGVPNPPTKCRPFNFPGSVDQISDISYVSSVISQPSPQAKHSRVTEPPYYLNDPEQYYKPERRIKIETPTPPPTPVKPEVISIPEALRVTPFPDPSVQYQPTKLYQPVTPAPVQQTTQSQQPLPNINFLNAATPFPNLNLLQQQQYLQQIQQQYLLNSKLPPSIVIPIPIPVPLSAVSASNNPATNAPAPPPVEVSEEPIVYTPPPPKTAPAPPPTTKKDLTNEQLLDVLKTLLTDNKNNDKEEETIDHPGSQMELLLAKLAAERRHELPQLLSNPIERLMINLVSSNSLTQRSNLIDHFLDEYDIA